MMDEPMRRQISKEGRGFSRAVKFDAGAVICRFYGRTEEAAEKLPFLKGTAFRPYM
jgi:hypothetical protein